MVTVTGDTQSVTDYAYGAVLAGVRDGTYHAGERLTEARLTRELGVSRVPLREALKRLAGEGVLEFYPNRGVVVRVLTRQDIADFFQLRASMEGLASRLTAGRVGEDGNRDHFARLLESARHPGSDHGAEAFMRHDAQIHGGIMERCGNRLLIRHWELLQLPVHRLRYFAGTTAWDFSTSVGDHERILAAVVTGDGRRAQELMAAHVERVAASVLQLSQADFDAAFNPRPR